MKMHWIIAGAALSTAVCGQTPPSAPSHANTPPVEVRRQPPEGVPETGKYPFEQLLGIARDGQYQSDPWQTVRAASEKTARVIPDAALVAPAKDIPLSPMATEALGVTQAWMAEKHVAAAGKDGRVLYTYGTGLATVVCAPLRICIVELEPGEKITGEPQIGDSVRWIISPATSGRGSQETPMVVIKPKQAGLDTTLLITTDRRAYYLRLVSKTDDFLARVAFAYPEDEVRRWKAHLAEQEQRQREELSVSRIAPVESIDSLYFDYRIIGGDVNMRPVRVVDDGRKTYIQMTPNAAAREAPVLCPHAARYQRSDGAELGAGTI